MRPLAGNAFMRPAQNFSRSASLRLISNRVAPASFITATMRANSSSTSSGVPSLSQISVAAASRS